MPITRRALVQAGLASASLAALPSTSFAADPFPSKPMRIVVPAAAGGLSDIVARAVSPEIEKELGQPMIVENRPGGGMMLGSRIVAMAPPDGYTVGLLSGSLLVVQPYVMSDDYPDAMRRARLLTILFDGPMILAVPSNHPAKNLAEYVAMIKQDGKPALVGVTAIGGLPHLAAELFAEVAGIRIQPVVYGGGNMIAQAMMGGTLPAAVEAIASLREYALAGKLRILAVASERRHPMLPDVPTFAEAGYPGVIAKFWQGIVAPPGLPDDIASRLEKSFIKAMALPSVRARVPPDLNVLASTSAEAATTREADAKLWERVVRARGITLSK